MGIIKYCRESIKSSSYPSNNKGNVKVSVGEFKVRSAAHNTLSLSKIEDLNTSVCVEHKKALNLRLFLLHSNIASALLLPHILTLCWLTCLEKLKVVSPLNIILAVKSSSYYSFGRTSQQNL
jgi:hypothetical protein